ncbi:diadenylate cyclase CdaA [Fructilactobacillus carniphilus]|uniref:Diadenylate cyclase n=1 Tax=Fructilactobacillus carniphilus TaxID=2940297 RepID=A0ABY5BXZ1_9LACO|nr:diadenylate cyclase CdaA [Fructilactobacillus carniphilus]USS91372.1 diadenylate cyclase CdaA [Fructilactobacillus carniphilus]
MEINWSNILTLHNLSNVLDILVVWILIYELFMLLKGTRSIQLLRGIVVLVIAKVLSWYLGLTMTSWILDQVINWGVIGCIVIFQPEIRRGLEKLGQQSVFKQSQQANERTEKVIKALDGAIQYLSKRRIGALIAIQMKTGLEEWIEKGIALDADVSSELLINIFIPNTPLHDGAVIIKDDRIAAANAYLPPSDSNLIPRELGTRHRAAVGLSEVTDAITIVVSEETGEVSFTQNNELLRGMSREDYLKYLRSHLLQPSQKKTWHGEVHDFFAKLMGGGK